MRDFERFLLGDLFTSPEEESAPYLGSDHFDLKLPCKGRPPFNLESNRHVRYAYGSWDSASFFTKVRCCDDA